MKRICRYLQGTKDNGIVFNPHKKIVVDCYDDEYFLGIWVHENPKDYICARIINGFVVTFTNYPLLWVSELQTEIALSTLNSEYVEFSNSFRELLNLKSITK